MKVSSALRHPAGVEEAEDRPVNAQTLTITGDVELIARCRAGDDTAWKALHDAHFEFVWKVARRLGTPPEELDDVCQETFLVAFRRMEQFHTGRLTTWLYRIVENVVSARHRKRRVRRVLGSLFSRAAPEPIVWRTPHDEAVRRQCEAHVAQVLERMAPKKREVFALFELEGLSGEQIAERVGCKVATVWTRLHHARRDFERIARKRGLVS